MKKRGMGCDAARRAGMWGVTLVELMVTLAVAAILIAIATPSFTSLINSNRLSGSANELVAALQTARMEAVRRNARVIVCRSENSQSCAGAGDLWPAWLVFVDADADGVLDAGEAVLRVGQPHSAVQVRASPALTVDRLLFRPDGFARDSATPNGSLLTASFGVCMPTDRPAQNIRVVSVASGSRITTLPETGGGTCPTSVAN